MGLLIVVILLLLAVVALQILQLRRNGGPDVSPLERVFAAVEKSHERMERLVREEIAANREEAARCDRDGREETSRRLDQMRAEADVGVRKVRDEVAAELRNFETSVQRSLESLGELQRTRLTHLGDSLTKLTDSNTKSLDAVRGAVEERLKAMQADNGKSLEQMRQTVDEKLQGTLERRLSESFNVVSERLEQVYKGLGEMQTLATGVGDLKRVLTNVKSRGTWGEVQLGALLEQVLSPDQFETNADVKDNGERVEFAIKLPNRGENESEVLYLPIDAKFPIEDYQRLIDAQERADLDAAEHSAKQLEIRIRQCAKEICGKYINPPKTTDFAILFLPTEGLFAEVLRRAGLPEAIQRECRVVIAGPTTLWSILNSLQMGFRTLAIQKRSSEVWNVLGAVKTEFQKYSEVLAKVQRKLQDASRIIDDDVAKRARVIQRKLRAVEALPVEEAQPLLASPAFDRADGLFEDDE